MSAAPMPMLPPSSQPQRRRCSGTPGEPSSVPQHRIKSQMIRLPRMRVRCRTPSTPTCIRAQTSMCVHAHSPSCRSPGQLHHSPCRPWPAQARLQPCCKRCVHASLAPKATWTPGGRTAPSTIIAGIIAHLSAMARGPSPSRSAAATAGEPGPCCEHRPREMATRRVAPLVMALGLGLGWGQHAV